PTVILPAAPLLIPPTILLSLPSAGAAHNRQPPSRSQPKASTAYSPFRKALPLVILMLVLGLVVLTAGAELLVRGASKLAIAVGISPLVVGLTVVAFGTSAPELVVSVHSTMTGQA